MRDYTYFYLNHEPQKIYGEDCFLTLSQFLRQKKRLMGTKVVCEEGDCGACTILLGRKLNHNFEYKSVLSCISFVYLLDGCHIITIEGLQEKGHEYNEIQKAMLDQHGSQCGFCTPGFVMSMTYMAESHNRKTVKREKAKNFLTGNLCRCTGYEPILKACEALDFTKISSLKILYNTKKIEKDLKFETKNSFQIMSSSGKIIGVKNSYDLDEVLSSSENHQVVGFSSDLGVMHNKGRLASGGSYLILHGIDSMHQISLDHNRIQLKASVTLDQLRLVSENIAPSLANLLNIFASPQVKHVSTVVGNVANASPIADLPPYLLICDAILTLRSAQGNKEILLKDFYKDYKVTALQPGEVITEISFDCIENIGFTKYYKVSRRRDLDISCVSGVFHLSFEGTKVKDFRIAYGGLAPYPIRLFELENLINNQDCLVNLQKIVGDYLDHHLKPISDIRGSKEYRLALAKNLFKKFLTQEIGL